MEIETTEEQAEVLRVLLIINDYASIGTILSVIQSRDHTYSKDQWHVEEVLNSLDRVNLVHKRTDNNQYRINTCFSILQLFSFLKVQL